MKRIVAVLFLMAFAIPVVAVGKVTDDPNKKPAVAEATADLKTDAKLAQKVTYTATKKSVSVILEELSKSTGVLIKAGRNSSDWQVRDRKMNIYAKDVPLNELMNSMSRVMKFKWEISGKPGAYTYRLFMDRRSLLDAEAQRVRAEQKQEEERARKRQNGLLQYGKLGSLTPEEKAQLRNDNPFMYFIAKTGMGSSLGSFFQESPGALEAISTGQKFQIKGSALSQKAQAGVVESMKQMMEMEKKFGGSGRSLPDSFDMNTVDIRINQNMDMIKGMPQGNMLLGEMSFNYGDRGHVEVPLIDPDSTMTKMIGKALLMCDEQGRPMNEVMKEIGPEFMASVVKEMKSSVGGEPLVEHADDPALKAKVKLEPKGATLADMEEALAKASKFAVVSDHFGAFGIPMGTAGLTAELEIKAVLDKIAENFTYNWDKKSGVIEFRDRNWFKKRAAQIPDAWLEAWRQELVKTGTLEIDALAQMAALTPEQVSANVMGDETLGRTTGTIFSWREVLRLYGGLSSDQRSMLFTASGLPLRVLNEDQWSQAQKAAQGGKAGLELSRRYSLTATRKSNDDKSLTYKLDLLDENKGSAFSWSLYTPTYTPPAPKKNPAPAKPGDQKPGDPKPAGADKPTPQPADPDQPK